MVDALVAGALLGLKITTAFWTFLLLSFLTATIFKSLTKRLVAGLTGLLARTQPGRASGVRMGGPSGPH